MGSLLKVGLTGGIGSGKTTVAALFHDCGAPCIDADQISHAVTEPGEPGYKGIIELFGAEVVDADKRLNRRKIREIVFNDHALKTKLEKLIHPLVRAGIQQFVEQAKYNYCIIGIPLLLETNATSNIDRILVVDLPEDLQIIRACNRDNATKESIESIIKAQIPREQRLTKADDVIHNTKDLNYLKQQVEALHEKYLRLGSKQ